MIRLLLTSGRGPGECRIALAETLDVLVHEAVAAGLDLNVVRGPAPDGNGPASAIALLDGDGAEAFAASWVGSILWVARSPLRPHHKRKNWFIAVVRLAPRAIEPPELNATDVRFEAFGAGGPGGQHQNKTASAIRAVHRPTGLAVVARDGRSQHRNKALALERLGALLKLKDELACAADNQQVQSGHSRLERGRPIRTFEGRDFRSRPETKQ
jgi:peptide chain release factor